jgi:CRP/FNR family transcriptional regulator, cyclic AMP receptor protein
VHASLRRAEIFDGVPPAAARALARRLIRADFPSGHTVFGEGQPGDRMYIIVSGKVKISCRSGGGREAVLAILGTSDIFGELSLYDPGPRTSTAVTLTNLRAMSMDRAVLRWWIAEQRGAADALLAGLSRRLQRTSDELCELANTDVAGRAAAKLLVLAQRFGTRDGTKIQALDDLTAEDFAGFVGSPSSSVNQVLTDFADRGWIRLTGRNVVILDADALASTMPRPRLW